MNLLLLPYCWTKSCIF